MTTQTLIAFGCAALLSYLLGSLNFALIVSGLVAKDDIRRYGSGNAGMTNMLRTYGKKLAVATALGDFSKTVAAVFLSRWIFSCFSVTIMDAGYLSGLFVLLGHMYPLYFKFRGGKGVITCLAIISVTNPLAFIIVSVFFIPFVFITKIVSLGSILGAITYPILTFLLLWFQGKPFVYDTIFASVIGMIILVNHRENIKRLLNGTENKFGQKK